jgi:signal peptidase I
VNTLVLVAVFLLASFAVQTTVLWAAARVCRLERRGWWRVGVIVAAKLVIALAILVSIWTWGETPDSNMLVLGAGLVVDAIVTTGLLWLLFGGTLTRRLGTWVAHLFAGGIAGYILVLGMRTCVEALIWPNSSMSPNIRGYHVVETLPDGNHLIHAANPPDEQSPAIPPGEPSGAIVAETYEYREAPRPARHTHGPDRFLCNKTKMPRRWDVVAFHYPKDPTLKYIKRLVGLPGEQLVIRDGAVWVNGERLAPPAGLGPIRFVSVPHFMGGQEDERLVTLGPDEYFVLGDNSNKSADSRDWGPVKRDLIVGVVDVIYWPPGRWRLNP